MDRTADSSAKAVVRCTAPTMPKQFDEERNAAL
jgi:hypothetical protein